VTVSGEFTADNNRADVSRGRRVSLDAVKRLRTVTAFAASDAEGIEPIIVAQTAIYGPVPRHSVVKDSGITDDRRLQTVVVMTVVAGARTVATAVERKAVTILS
jgi:hypothetical protein